MDHDTVIVGAGVVGAAVAYHLKRIDPDRNILLIDKEKRVGAGNTSKSAALYRNIFSSEASRLLATSSIRYYLELGFEVQINPIGYLWMFSKDQWEASSDAVAKLDGKRDDLEIVSSVDIIKMLNIDTGGAGRFPGISKAIYGHMCGSLSGMGLAQHYSRLFSELGGHIETSKEVESLTLKGSSSMFSPWDEKGLDSIETSDGDSIRSQEFIFATGAWTQDLLGSYGIFTGTLPKKRQLFGIRVDDPYQVAGDIELESVPALILPAGGTYVKPLLHKNLLILGLADDLGQPYDMRDHDPDEEYFTKGIRPVFEHYFPELIDWEIRMRWAGYYSYHWPDKNPVIESVSNITWVAGTSGSGIMKADAIGRITASRIMGQTITELHDGSQFKVSDISLRNRRVENESFVI